MLRVSLTPLPVKDSYALRPADLLSQAILGNRPESYRQLLGNVRRSEEHTSELQSQSNLVCRLLLEKKKEYHQYPHKRPFLPTLKALLHAPINSRIQR